MKLEGAGAKLGGSAPRHGPKTATAYTVPVAVLTFKVIQSRWFLSHLKGRVRLPTGINDQ